MSYLLGEISLYNSQYPVRRMYKQLKAKRDQSDQSKAEKPENKLSEYRQCNSIFNFETSRAEQVNTMYCNIFQIASKNRANK